MAPFLSLLDATFRLGDRLVFPDTSWEFHRNQHWAFLGPNGGGKSLFADCIRGRIPLVAGDLTYHFRTAGGLAPEDAIAYVSFEQRRKDIHGTVVQSRWNSLEEEGACTVQDYLSYARVMEINPFEIRHGDGFAQQKFHRSRRQAAQWLEIEPLFDRRLINLSNGERQRVELAHALCRPTRLLILDEPFSGLDAETRKHFARVLRLLMRSRLRVIVITTRQEELPRQISNRMWIQDCRVAEVVRSGRGKKLAFTDEHRRLNQDPGIGGASRPPANAAITKSPGKLASQLARTRTRTLIEFRNVTVRYGTKTILRDLNWKVDKGESWAVLGPNGSGKTTVLSLITGDNLQAYANEVRVFGRRRGTGESIWDLKQQIGWLSPEMHLHFDVQLTCLAAVESGFFETNGLFETPSRAQGLEAKRCLRRLELAKWADHPLYELSTGLQRMVLLARALVKQPRLLVLDEPCQGLDREHRELLIRRVDALIRTGATTVLYVTHRKDELPPSLRRTLKLPDGKMERRL